MANDTRERVYPGWLEKRERALVTARRTAAGRDDTDDQIGFALSGGGIRSATFCLGLFQALARRGLIRRIDYLSTVSGGGYFGGFLGSLFARAATGLPEPDGKLRVDVVEDALANSGSPPVRRLRQNGRYLSPAGVGDLLLAAAVQLRNLVSLHVILGAALITAALGSLAARGPLERLWTTAFGPCFPWNPWLTAALAPLLLVAVPTGWAYWLTQRGRRGRPALWPVVTTVAIVAGGLAIEGTGWTRVNQWLGWDATSTIRALWAIALLALVVWGLAEWQTVVANREKQAATGGDSTLDDVESRLLLLRNWLSRGTMAGLLLAAGLAAIGAIDALGRSLYEVAYKEGVWALLRRPTVWPPVATMLAAIAAIKRFAGMLPSQERLRVPWQAAAWLAAILIGTTLTTIWAAVAYALVWPGRLPVSPTPSGRAAIGLAAGVLLCVLLGRVMQFVNNSSAHALYAARLTRAYLGASNPAREEARATRVSEVVKGDAISWHGYQPHTRGGPAHLVNVTINETIGGRDQIEYRDRKGLMMALGPVGVSVGARHHAWWEWRQDARGRGPWLHVARPKPVGDEPFHPLFNAGNIEHEVQARQLGHWMAISGAAFTTGLGSRTSLPLAVLLGLANVRLGYWWDSHITPGRHAHEAPMGPKRRVMSFVERCLPVQTGLIDELLARFWGPAKTYWYLSDGGHFENTACYELLRRRLPFIVCCDCGADPGYTWTDLANLVRKARIDFGAEIRFLGSGELDREVKADRLADVCALDQIVAPQGPDGDGGNKPKGDPWRWAGGHAALAHVRYHHAGGAREEKAADAPPDALLLVVKPSLTGDEPADVQEYARAHPSFPHESTLDQYFDEAQWESYRRLGEHIGERLFRKGNDWFPARKGTPPGATPAAQA